MIPIICGLCNVYNIIKNILKFWVVNKLIFTRKTIAKSLNTKEGKTLKKMPGKFVEKFHALEKIHEKI